MLLLGPRCRPTRRSALSRSLAAAGAVLALGLLPGAGPAGAAVLPAAQLVGLPLDASAPQDAGISTFGVQASSATLPDARPHFTYTAVPGAVINDFLAVSNYSTGSVSLHLYAGDAFTNNDGGFDLTPAAQKPRDIGAWATIGNANITLASRTRSILPFRLVVPADAKPGDHTGGIIASLSITNRDKSGDVVTVEHRLAERIYLRIPGVQRPHLSVQDLGASYDNNLNPFGTGRVTARYRLVNDGNVRLGAKLSASLSDPTGSGPLGAGQAIPELLPGSSLAVTAVQAARVALFHATAHIRVEPVNLGSPGDSKAPVVLASADVWALSSSALAALLALILLLITGLVLRARRHRRPTGSHARSKSGGPTRSPSHSKVEVA